MHTYLQHLVTWTSLHPQWAGILLFFISAVEALTLIGALIPGSILLVAVGTLVGAGVLPFSQMALWAASGAVVGDGLSFLMGRFLKDDLRKVWPFSRNTHWLDRGTNFFEKYGRTSVFIGRFIGPLRAFIPVTAGALCMPSLRFFIIDIISAITWAVAYMLPGILLGAASLQLPPDIATHYMRVVLTTLIISAAIIWIVRLSFLHITEVVQHALTCLWQAINHSKSWRFLRQWLRHYRPDHPRGQLGFLATWLLLVIIFITMCYSVAHKSALSQVNDAIYHFLRSIRNLQTDKIMTVVSAFGYKYVLLATGGVSILWLAFQRCWRSAAHLACVVVFGAIIIFLVKHVMAIPRPHGLFAQKDSFSFPSGHTTYATIVYGGLAYFSASSLARIARWPFYAVACLIVIAIGFSRIYVGDHWFSDVLGGILLGSICLLAMGISYQRRSKELISPIYLPIISLATLLVVGSYYTASTYKQNLQNHQPAWPDTTIAMQTWWEQTNPDPDKLLYATNRFGSPKNIFNIQWADEISTINNKLQDLGWAQPAPANWVYEMQHPEKTHSKQPHFKTELYLDRKAKYTFTKTTPDGQYMLALRLWDTGYHFDQYPLTLWAGVFSIYSTGPKPVSMDTEKRLMNEFLTSLELSTQLIAPPSSMRLARLHLNNPQLALIRPKQKHKIT